MRGTLFFVALVYLVLLFLRPQEAIPGMEQSSILQVTLLTALVLWVFTKDKRASEPYFLLLPPLIMLAWFGMGLNGWWGGISKIAAVLIPSMVAFVVLTGAVRSVRQQRIMQWGIVLAGCIMVLHGQWQLRDGIGWMGTKPIEGRITYSGIFNDPNDLGLMFVMAIASAFYLRGATRGFILRTALLAAVGWLCFGVYLTNSRGTLLAALVVTGLFAWRRYGKTAVVTAAVIGVPALAAVTRLSQVDADEESAEGRIDAWYEGLDMLKEHPLFGVGYSNFTDHNALTAHNSIVLAMSELGLTGFTFWLAFVGLVGWSVWALVRRGTQAVPPGTDPAAVEQELDALRALLVMAVGFAVCAFFLSQSFKPPLFVVAGLMIGRYFGAQQVLGQFQTPGLGAVLARGAAAALAWPIFLFILLKLLL